jgi:3-hydroxyacyl-[acyl-carrier-protein] dehydratase
MNVAAKELLVDPSTLDFNQIVADIEDIRKYNPQRFEMEQLTAILYDDGEQNLCVGYKDLKDDEFWVRGHMPGMPLMPGVIICEAAAQLSSYHVQKHNLMGAEMMGFGGLDNVRFRGAVFPGKRLVIACKLIRLRRKRMSICHFQGFVDNQLVVEGEIRGIALPTDALRQPTPESGTPE